MVDTERPGAPTGEETGLTTGLATGVLTLRLRTGQAGLQALLQAAVTPQLSLSRRHSDNPTEAVSDK